MGEVNKLLARDAAGFAGHYNKKKQFVCSGVTHSWAFVAICLQSQLHVLINIQFINMLSYYCFHDIFHMFAMCCRFIYQLVQSSCDACQCSSNIQHSLHSTAAHVVLVLIYEQHVCIMLIGLRSVFISVVGVGVCLSSSSGVVNHFLFFIFYVFIFYFFIFYFLFFIFYFFIFLFFILLCLH